MWITVWKRSIDSIVRRGAPPGAATGSAVPAAVSCPLSHRPGARGDESHVDPNRILIIDYGSRFTQLIARRIREGGVYCEIHPPTRSLEWIREWAPRGI